MSNEDLIDCFELTVEKLVIYEQDILNYGESELNPDELNARYKSFKAELVKRFKEID